MVLITYLSETNWAEISTIPYTPFNNPLQVRLSSDSLWYGFIEMYEDNSKFGSIVWFPRADYYWDIRISNCDTYHYSTPPCPGTTLQTWTFYFNSTHFILHCDDLPVFTLQYNGTCEEVWSEVDRVNGLGFNHPLSGSHYRSMLTGEIIV